MSQPIVSTGATYFFRISFIALYCSSQSGGVGWGTSSDICMSFFFLGEGDSNFMDLGLRDSDFRARVNFRVLVCRTGSSAEGWKSSDLTFTDVEYFARLDRLGLWL